MRPGRNVFCAVDKSKAAKILQSVVDAAPAAQHYSTDGYFAYIDVLFPGHHIRNAYDKSDTHSVESVNTDLYNRYGAYKLKYRIPVKHNPLSTGKLHKWRTPIPGIVDFVSYGKYT
jgi:hypothetical protein